MELEFFLNVTDNYFDRNISILAFIMASDTLPVA